MVWTTKHSLYWTVIAAVLATTVLLAVEISPIAGQSNYGCSYRGHCGYTSNFLGWKLSIPCLYDGQPQKLQNESTLEILKTFMPEFMDDGDDSVFCCNDNQILNQEMQMKATRTLVGRCPSCFYNLARVFYIMTCSPRQKEFVKIIKSENASVHEIDYHLTESVAQGFYNSCIEVSMPSTNGKVVREMMCQPLYKGETCTPKILLRSLGKKDPAPMQINFKYSSQDSSIVPNDQSIVKCSQYPPTYSNHSCSCMDCSEICPVPKPIPEDSKQWKVLGIDGIELVMAFVYIGLFVVTVVSFVFYNHYYNNNEVNVDINNQDQSSDEPNESSFCQQTIGHLFGHYGVLCIKTPFCFIFPLIGIAMAIGFSSGITRFETTTDPIKLWTTPTSKVKLEKDYYDQNFGPFYRPETIIITPTNMGNVDYNGSTYGPVFNQTFLLNVLKLQQKIMAITIEKDNKTIRIEDLCFAPMDNNICMVQSIMGWIQDKRELLERDNYLDHLEYCTRNAFSFKDSCAAAYGGPVFPNIALGDYSGKNYIGAKALIFTITLNNAVRDEDNENAEKWEFEFLKLLKDYDDPSMSLAFYSQRSIEDELDRLSKSSIYTIAISYMVMFIYIAIALGDFTSYQRILVDSKIVVGLCGVVIVLISVLASIGLLSYAGVKSTLIIVEVIPFLVLAVGVDNIFILVQHFNRIKLNDDEIASLSYDQGLQLRIRRLLTSVAPSILMAALAESTCFFLGALTPMPAVRIFAINAGTAILMATVFQMLIFIPLLALDARRQDQNRYEVFYCMRAKGKKQVGSSSSSNSTKKSSSRNFLYSFFNETYAPFLLKPLVRLIVILLFLAWLCVSISVINKIEVGLEQKLSMPTDSYVIHFLNEQKAKLRVGPPVYFVIDGEFDYANKQQLMCGRSGCYSLSATALLSQAANNSANSYLSDLSASSWIDDYIDWMGSSECCRVFDNGTFCPRPDHANCSTSCSNDAISDSFIVPNMFYQPYFEYFLHDIPNTDCSKGGGPTYLHAINLDQTVNISRPIKASYFMTYHVPLVDSKDYIKALKNARVIADNIADSLNTQINLNNPDSTKVTVFPYSFFYVFYEQYLTIWHDAVVNISAAFGAIFFVTLIFFSFNLMAALVIVFTIASTTANLMGLMYFWNISFCAISLVNLVMGIGISVEFCSHIARAVILSNHQSKIVRAKEGLAEMGSSVLSGITMTKFFGILILAFSPSKIFHVFYFRMYLGIVIIGALHGLVFLPVLFSVVNTNFLRIRCKSI